MMRLWLGVVLCSGAWLYLGEAFTPRRLEFGLLCLGVGLVSFGAGLWSCWPRPIKSQDWKRLGWSFLLAAMTLLAAQALFHLAYWQFTPYWQPRTGAGLLARLFALIGLPASATGGLISVQTDTGVVQILPSLARLGVYSLGLTWAGSVTVLGIGSGRRRFLYALALAGLLAAYALLRFLFLAVLSIDLQTPALFWNPTVSLLLLAPAGLGAAWLAPNPGAAALLAGLDRAAARKLGLAAAWAALCALCLSLACGYEAHGQRKPGRVLLDDFHSGSWEPAAGEFGEEALGYGQVYNYRLLRKWLEEFYTVRVNTDGLITDALLANADVLLLVTPVRPFLQSEREAVVRFVRRGGGLWVIGDHTNLFGTSTYLNALLQPFGIRFNFDDEFDLTTGRPNLLRRPWLWSHPILTAVPLMEFETSCTLQAPLSARPAIIGNMLGAEMVDYGHPNFFGNMQVDPQDDFGLFLQCLSLTCGQGRVLAFADSTVFSSFSMFAPGVAELALGSVEYLNRTAPSRWPAVLLALAGGLAAIATGRVCPWRQPASMAALAVSLLAGCLLGGLLASSLNCYRDAMFTHGLKSKRDLLDNSICSFRIPSSLDYPVLDPERCFDAFYLNLARVGLRPAVGDALHSPSAPQGVRVFLLPTLMPDQAALQNLRAFVEAGGHVLVVESDRWVSPATVTLLAKLGIKLSGQREGEWRVSSAQPVFIPAKLQPRNKADVKIFRRKLGRGGVMLVLGSEGFSQTHMGQVYSMPDPLQREWYRLEYFLLHQLTEKPYRL